MSRIVDIQHEHHAWAVRNFPGSTPWQALLGVMEEGGELAHAYLKQSQMIRTDEDHRAAARDAVGDITIYLMHFCTLMGWDLEYVVEEAWAKVQKRDWRKDPVKGGA